MKWPPYLLKLRIKQGRHDFCLWIPLFIIGPIALIFLLALFLIALPFLILSILFTWRWDWGRYVIVGIPALFNILHSLPGTKVDIGDEEQHVLVAFY
jgi:hypothetical protein